MTPLHAACLAGNIIAVDLLLDQPNVDFMKKDKVSIQLLMFHSREIS